MSQVCLKKKRFDVYFLEVCMYQRSDAQKAKMLPLHELYTTRYGAQTARYSIPANGAAGRRLPSNYVTIRISDLQAGAEESGPAFVSWVWHQPCQWSKNNLQYTIWWEGSVFAPCSSKEDCQVLQYKFSGLGPSSLAHESGLWECRLWDQNCIKDYFGLRMSLISQALTVVCRLGDFKFSHNLPHRSGENGVLKSTCEELGMSMSKNVSNSVWATVFLLNVPSHLK